MDKILNGIKDFGTIKRYLEAINQTTDDFLFVYDIKNNQNHFFGSITDVFDIGSPDKETVTAEELLAIVHPADRKTVTREFEEICKGSKDSHDLDFRIFNKRGETVWVNSRGKILHNENGAPMLMLGRLSEEAVRHLFNPITGDHQYRSIANNLKLFWDFTTHAESLAARNYYKIFFHNQILFRTASVSAKSLPLQSHRASRQLRNRNQMKLPARKQ